MPRLALALLAASLLAVAGCGDDTPGGDGSDTRGDRDATGDGSAVDNEAPHDADEDLHGFFDAVLSADHPELELRFLGEFDTDAVSGRSEHVLFAADPRSTLALAWDSGETLVDAWQVEWRWGGDTIARLRTTDDGTFAQLDYDALTTFADASETVIDPDGEIDEVLALISAEDELTGDLSWVLTDDDPAGNPVFDGPMAVADADGLIVDAVRHADAEHDGQSLPAEAVARALVAVQAAVLDAPELADQSGDYRGPDDVDVPLSVGDGRVSVGLGALAVAMQASDDDRGQARDHGLDTLTVDVEFRERGTASRTPAEPVDPRGDEGPVAIAAWFSANLVRGAVAGHYDFVSGGWWALDAVPLDEHHPDADDAEEWPDAREER